MGRARKIDDEQLAECRWFYEHCRITHDTIASAFGIKRGSMQRWAHIQKWARYQPPKDVETRARHDIAAHDRMVKRQAQTAHDKEVARGLEQALKLLRPPETPPDRPISDDPQPFVAKPAINLSNPSTNKNSVVVAFPGAKLPPRKDKENSQERLSREEQAAVQIRLAGLQGTLAVQQLDLIEDHKRLLGDYTHLMRIYLNPQNYVQTDPGLSEADADRQLQDIQRAARNLLLPTERDTLAGAMTTAANALKTIIQLGRVVAGVAKGGELVPGAQPETLTDKLATLELNDMRDIKRAMDLLTGHNQAHEIPPVPPPPEPLDDLMAPPADEPPPGGVL